MSQTTLSVVAPVYCEGDHLPEFVAALAAELTQLKSTSGLHYEIILVDDGSSDNTWEVMRTLTAQHANLRCLRLSRNFGKDAALAAGLDAARGDAVITMDSDMQHPASLIPEMVALWRSGNVDVVDVRITRVDYVEAITESVYRRMEAERKRVANELRSTGAAEGEKIRADADRQREIAIANAYRDAQKIKGEGDAEAARQYAEAFGRIRSLLSSIAAWRPTRPASTARATWWCLIHPPPISSRRFVAARHPAR